MQSTKMKTIYLKQPEKKGKTKIKANELLVRQK